MGAKPSIPGPIIPGSKSAREVAQQSPIGKEYAVEKTILGEGTFSTVLLAKHKTTQTTVAVKNLAAENIEQAYSEIEVLHFLGKHKHVAEMLGAYTSSRQSWIVLELCAGGDIFEYFQMNPLSEEPLREAMAGVFSALDFCHSRGIAHRDVKPDNILLKVSDRPHVYLCDFGSAVHFTDTNDYRDDMVGTACYVAPEVIRQRYQPALADVWSAGMTMFCILANEPAYDGPYEELTLQRILNKKLILPPSITKKVSPVGQHFLLYLLRRKLNERLTAAGALQHRWLVTGMGSDMVVPEPEDPAATASPTGTATASPASSSAPATKPASPSPPPPGASPSPPPLVAV